MMMENNSKAQDSAAPAEQLQTTEEKIDEGATQAGKEEETAGGEEGTETAVSMTPSQRMAAVEAILFAMGDSVEVAAMAKALNCSTFQINQAVDALEERYSSESSGIMLQRFDDAVQLSTKPEQYQNLIRIAKVPKKLTLSDAVIETLSIVAYKQPITKAEVEQIRGVSSDYAINRLLSYDLIKELGRQDSPGRPILFGTTEQFLRTFGVRKLSDLPQPSTATKEEFREEAEAEVDEKLNV